MSVKRYPTDRFHGCRAYLTTPTPFNNTVVTFGGEFYDTDGFHDNSTNNSRLTVPPGLAGYYLINGRAFGQANNSFEIYLMVNGVALPNSLVLKSSTVAWGGISTSESAHLADGDYVQLYVTTNITYYGDSANNAGTSLSIARLGA